MPSSGSIRNFSILKLNLKKKDLKALNCWSAFQIPGREPIPVSGVLNPENTVPNTFHQSTFNSDRATYL